MVLHVLVNIWKKVLDLGEKNSEEIFFPDSAFLWWFNNYAFPGDGLNLQDALGEDSAGDSSLQSNGS